ncbi:hypothetical protein HDU96_008215 [Phlyctochytrium bullatum]|nr:hypothetical protein HDU96_008215 [Phlyctochytrium bullatum]
MVASAAYDGRLPGQGIVNEEWIPVAAFVRSLPAPASSPSSPDAKAMLVRRTVPLPEEDALWKRHEREVAEFVQRTRTQLLPALRFLAAKGFDVERAVHLFHECKRAADDPAQIALSSTPPWILLSNPVLCLTPGGFDRHGAGILLLNVRFWEPEMDGLKRMHWLLRFLADRAIDISPEILLNGVTLISNAESAPESVALSEVHSTVVDLLLYTTPLRLTKLLVVNAPWTWSYLPRSLSSLIPFSSSSLAAPARPPSRASAGTPTPSMADEMGTMVVRSPDGYGPADGLPLRAFEPNEVPVVVCSSPQRLFDHVDPESVVEELGGKLKYEHEDWVRETLLTLNRSASPTNQSVVVSKPAIPSRHTSLSVVRRPPRTNSLSSSTGRSTPGPSNPSPTPSIASSHPSGPPQVQVTYRHKSELKIDAADTVELWERRVFEDGVTRNVSVSRSITQKTPGTSLAAPAGRVIPVRRSSWRGSVGPGVDDGFAAAAAAAVAHVNGVRAITAGPDLPRATSPAGRLPQSLFEAAAVAATTPKLTELSDSDSDSAIPVPRFTAAEKGKGKAADYMFPTPHPAPPAAAPPSVTVFATAPGGSGSSGPARPASSASRTTPASPLVLPAPAAVPVVPATIPPVLAAPPPPVAPVDPFRMYEPGDNGWGTRSLDQGLLDRLQSIPAPAPPVAVEVVPGGAAGRRMTLDGTGSVTAGGLVGAKRAASVARSVGGVIVESGEMSLLKAAFGPDRAYGGSVVEEPRMVNGGGAFEANGWRNGELAVPPAASGGLVRAGSKSVPRKLVEKQTKKVGFGDLDGEDDEEEELAGGRRSQVGGRGGRRRVSFASTKEVIQYERDEEEEEEDGEVGGEEGDEDGTDARNGVGFAAAVAAAAASTLVPRPRGSSRDYMTGAPGAPPMRSSLTANGWLKTGLGDGDGVEDGGKVRLTPRVDAATLASMGRRTSSLQD